MLHGVINKSIKWNDGHRVHAVGTSGVLSQKFLATCERAVKAAVAMNETIMTLWKYYLAWGWNALLIPLAEFRILTSLSARLLTNGAGAAFKSPLKHKSKNKNQWFLVTQMRAFHVYTILQFSLARVNKNEKQQKEWFPFVQGHSFAPSFIASKSLQKRIQVDFLQTKKEVRLLGCFITLT